MPKPDASSSLFGLLAEFIARNKRAYLTAALLLACISVLSAWIPRKIGQVVDALVANPANTDAMLADLGLLLGAAVAIYFMRAGWRLSLFGAAYKLSVELRVRLYARLSMHAPSFYQDRRTGDLMASATNDIDAVELAAAEAAFSGFDGSLTLILMVCMMTFGVDWRLGLCALLPFPAMALGFWWISRHVHDAARASLDQFGHLNDHVQESISGVRTLRALGLLPSNTQVFARHAQAAAGASLNEQRWEAAFEPTVGTTLSLAVVLSLAMGSYLVWHNEITIGQMTSFGIYLGHLIWPMFAAGWVISLLERGRAAWARLQPLLEDPVSVADAGGQRLEPQSPIVFSGITFTYPGQTQPALKHVDVRLSPGKVLALVGPTGSGKSTVVKLLLRQWQAQSGSIHWGDHALDQYSLDSLRQAVAWIPQEPFLFSASIAQNIALAKPDASAAEVQDAARLAMIHDDIAALPEGYATPVGERGVTLSGGQRQRVAIARALLANAPVLVLDDALSAVDTATEAQILSGLRGLNAKAALRGEPARTVIVLSHRLSGVVHADEIIVLRAGVASERGTHAELVQLGAWYARQWRFQQLQESLELLDAPGVAVSSGLSP